MVSTLHRVREGVIEFLSRLRQMALSLQVGRSLLFGQIRCGVQRKDLDLLLQNAGLG